MREWVKRNVKCTANSAEICHFLWTGQNPLVKIKNLKAKIISKNSKAKIPGRFLPNKDFTARPAAEREERPSRLTVLGLPE